MSRFDKLQSIDTNVKSSVEEKSTTTPVKKSSPVNTGRNLPTYQTTNLPSFDRVEDGNEVAAIHKAMRDALVSTASYRMSAMEKKRLEVLLFQLKMRNISSPDLQEIRSNENEIMRIALNHLFNDYDLHKDESVLVKTLLSLRS